MFYIMAVLLQLIILNRQEVEKLCKDDIYWYIQWK